MRLYFFLLCEVTVSRSVSVCVCWGVSSLCNAGTLLSQVIISAGLHGRHPDRSEAAVLSVRARVLLSDPPDTAAGHDRMTAARRDPKPPADVLPVGTVTQGGGLASVGG